MPEIWRNPPAEALQAGHGGGDYFEVREFVDSINKKYGDGNLDLTTGVFTPKPVVETTENYIIFNIIIYLS